MTDLPTARIPFGTWQEFARFLTQKSSGDGLFIRTPEPPHVGTELGLQFRFPDQNVLDLVARVVAVQHAPAATPGMTVQITSMSAEQAELIQHAIRQASAAPREGQGASPSNLGAGSGAPGGAAADAVSAATRPQAPPLQQARPDATGAARFNEVARLADASKYDKAEERIRAMLADNPEDRDTRVWQLIIQARRLRSQFDFEQAMERYEQALMLDGAHVEARRELEVLGGEAERSKSMMERVFGGGG